MKKILSFFLFLCCFVSLPIYALESDINDSNDTVIFGEITANDVFASIYEADIKSLREALQLGLITSSKLTEIYLERIEEFGGAKKCFITLCDNALEEAGKRDEVLQNGEGDGLLFGIPVVVKDNIEYEGYPTTNGYKKDGTVSDTNAKIVQYLLEEGAVILGKTNMSTAAQEARITISKAVGETTNAYSFEMASGGSSGGTAVSVSLNLAAAGLGTDTNSSLRYPAVLNGCVSMRSTFALVSTDGCIQLNSKRDVAGAITRTVYDQALMLDVITGGQYSFTENLNVDALKGVRLGIIKELSYAYGSSTRSSKYIDSEIQDAFANAVAELRACGAEVIEVSFPRIFSLSSACSKNSASAIDKYYSAYEKVLVDNNLSAFIFPSYITAPLYTGVNENGGLLVYDQTSTTNFSIVSPPLGIPEIAVPIGFHSRKSGIGIEFAGLRGEDQHILDLAYSYAMRYDHRTVPEYAENLYGDADISLSEIIKEYKAYLWLSTSEAGTDAPESADSATISDIAESTGNFSENDADGKPFSKLLIVAIILLIAILFFIIFLKLRNDAIRRRRRRMRRNGYRRR